jgi:hypothetical protein
MTKPKAKHYKDDLESFISESLKYKRYKEGVFYKNCRVEFKEITRRQKGFLKYKDIVVTNAFVMVKSNMASIYNEDFLFVENKLITGKYFSMCGTEIKKQTFNNHQKRIEENNRLKELLKQEEIKIQKEEEKQKQLLKYEQLQIDLSKLPPNEAFEKRWNSVEFKQASGLSWADFRNKLKLDFPNEWQILKQKFQMKQDIFI